MGTVRGPGSAASQMRRRISFGRVGKSVNFCSLRTGEEGIVLGCWWCVRSGVGASRKLRECWMDVKSENYCTVPT